MRACRENHLGRCLDNLFWNMFEVYHLNVSSSDRNSTLIRCAMWSFKGSNLVWLPVHEGDRLQSTQPSSGNWPRPQIVTGEGDEGTSRLSMLTAIRSRLPACILCDINLTGRWHNVVPQWFTFVLSFVLFLCMYWLQWTRTPGIHHSADYVTSKPNWLHQWWSIMYTFSIYQW